MQTYKRRTGEPPSPPTRTTARGGESGSDPLIKLERLLAQDWDDDNRISVIVNQPFAPAEKPSVLPPTLDPKSPLARWVVTIVLALAAVGGAVKMIQDLFE